MHRLITTTTSRPTPRPHASHRAPRTSRVAASRRDHVDCDAVQPHLAQLQRAPRSNDRPGILVLRAAFQAPPLLSPAGQLAHVALRVAVILFALPFLNAFALLTAAAAMLHFIAGGATSTAAALAPLSVLTRAVLRLSQTLLYASWHVTQAAEHGDGAEADASWALCVATAADLWRGLQARDVGSDIGVAGVWRTLSSCERRAPAAA